MPGMDFLNRKFLKLPMWVWILVLGAGVGIVLRMRNAANVDDTGEEIDEDTSAVGGDVTGGPSYDPSGFTGFPAYSQPINTQTDGIADTSFTDNITPALLDALKDQQDAFLDLVTNNGGAPGVQCGPNTVWDDEKQKCVSIVPTANAGSCGPGTKWDAGRRMCVPVTVTPTVPPKATAAKPAGAKNLHPVAKKCPKGQRWDHRRGTCTVCPSGTSYNGSKCAKCPAGYVC